MPFTKHNFVNIDQTYPDIFVRIYPFFNNTLLTILKYFKISKHKSELMSDLLHDYQQWKNLSSGLPCTKRLFDYQPLLGYFYLFGVISLIYLYLLVRTVFESQLVRNLWESACKELVELFFFSKVWYPGRLSLFYKTGSIFKYCVRSRTNGSQKNQPTLITTFFKEFHVTRQFTNKSPQLKQGKCHTVALPFTSNSILRQKKNYGNSSISPCKI
jgi:hypothetical protein